MIYKMKNRIQHYHWGTKTFLPELLKLKDVTEPCAELWMGAHPKASSMIEVDDQWVPLVQLAEDNKAILPEELNNIFKGFPYLFKILSIDSPLSIQVHPTIAQAEKGFQRENESGLAVDSPSRNYKDANHKPEIIFALSEFWALKGFRSYQEIMKHFSFASQGIKDKILQFQMEKNPHKSFYQWIMNLNEGEKNTLLDQFAETAQQNDIHRWVQTLSDHYPGDISSLAPLYLNLIHLQPGEALFQKAGELHAYLKGNGVELMANSDNVLRGGLTSKHMDMEELLKVVHFIPSDTDKVAFENYHFESPVKDFRLGMLKDFNEETIHLSCPPVILLNMGEELFIDDGNHSMKLEKGDTVLLDSDSLDITLTGKSGFCFWAVPGV